MDTVTVDQLLNSADWFKLGTYDLLPGAGHKVTVSDRSDGVAVGDAVRVVSSSQGARVARWSGTVGSTGAYQVWGRWTAAPGHAFAATYDITTPGGTQSVTVDQRSGGGQWHLLKTLSLAANDNWQVELSDDTPGEVVADAIAVTPPIHLSDKFEWAPTLPAAGEYAVYAKWQAAAGRATDAVYEVTHDGGVDQVTVDQTRDGGEWRYLGTWNLDPVNNPKVALLASLTGTLSADAVRFVAGDAVGGDVVYTHPDQIGTIQKLTDASGSLAWDRIARPFGETVSVTAASGVTQMQRFPGQYADETGLSYNYFRDYDPTLGRYLESDPIALAGGINTYAYVGGNPINQADPTGQNTVAGPSLFSSNSQVQQCGAKDDCIEKCWWLLERVKPFPGSDRNTWDFSRCVKACLTKGKSGFPAWDKLFRGAPLILLPPGFGEVLLRELCRMDPTLPECPDTI